MLRNYFVMAWRSLVKNRLYSLINIGGLSIGLGASMLILLFVAHEHSYDKFHRNADRIFSIYIRAKMGSDTVQIPITSYPTGPSILGANPATVSFLRIQRAYEKKTVQNAALPDRKFSEKEFLFADSNFYSFFSFGLKQGSPAGVLARPFTVVLTEEAARKYFGHENPIGKTLRYDSAYTFEITGIAARTPSNSSISYDFVASLSSLLAMREGWVIRRQQHVSPGTIETFLQLKNGANPANVEKTLNQLGKQASDLGDGPPVRFCLSPLTATHLGLNFDDADNTKYLHIFPLVAGLILLLALINYMNLATARASLRAREVGVRKVSGASRIKIAEQFYVESALFVFIAFGLGFALFRIAQPFFYRTLELTIDPSFMYQPLVLAGFGGLLLATIFVAGAYPSLVLSGYKPVAVLYGKASTQRGGLTIRKFLTVGQFSISVVLIICSALIGRQLYFFRHTDTGINRQHVLMVPFAPSIRDHYQGFKQDIRNLSGISGVATARYALYRGYDMTEISPKGEQVLDKRVSVVTLLVDEPFFSVMETQWKNKPVDRSIYSSDKKIIINEAAIGRLNLAPNPLGETVKIGDDGYRIAGVVKNFVYNSLHDKIEPLCLFVQKDTSTIWGGSTSGALFARIGPQTNLPSLIKSVKRVYELYDPNTAFEFEFMDDAFNARYKAEDRLAGVLDTFTGLIILIACLGLFGLAAFSASQKTREIGIRKVLGASVRSLVMLQTRSFIQWVLLAIVIAYPVAWWLMHRWLENFAYKISIGWDVFVYSALAALLIAVVTVSFESVRSSLANPAVSLRSE